MRRQPRRDSRGLPRRVPDPAQRVDQFQLQVGASQVRHHLRCRQRPDSAGAAVRRAVAALAAVVADRRGYRPGFVARIATPAHDLRTGRLARHHRDDGSLGRHHADAGADARRHLDHGADRHPGRHSHGHQPVGARDREPDPGRDADPASLRLPDSGGVLPGARQRFRDLRDMRLRRAAHGAAHQPRHPPGGQVHDRGGGRVRGDRSVRSCGACACRWPCRPS